MTYVPKHRGEPPTDEMTFTEYVTLGEVINSIIDTSNQHTTTLRAHNRVLHGLLDELRVVEEQVEALHLEITGLVRNP